MDRDGDDWRRIRVRAEDCPRIAPDFLAAERARLGDALYRQDYEAEFVAASRSVFDAAALAGMFGDTGAIDPLDANEHMRHEDTRMEGIARAAEAAARRGRHLSFKQERHRWHTHPCEPQPSAAR